MRVGFRRQEEVGEVGAQGLPLPIVAATAHIAIHRHPVLRPIGGSSAEQLKPQAQLSAGSLRHNRHLWIVSNVSVGFLCKPDTTVSAEIGEMAKRPTRRWRYGRCQARRTKIQRSEDKSCQVYGVHCAVSKQIPYVVWALTVIAGGFYLKSFGQLPTIPCLHAYHATVRITGTGISYHIPNIKRFWRG